MSYSSYLGLILPKNNGGNYGSPLVANSATDMTDHEKVYVYTGSEIGYVAGNWYYWNGITWTSGGVYNSQAISEEIENELTDIKSDLNDKASVIISSASGSIAHFEDGSESDAVDVVAHIEPVQDLHGYDNPWPAGGGKNKFNVDAIVQSSNITVLNGVISVTGQSISAGKTLGQLANLQVGETYMLTATTTTTANYIYLTVAGSSWYFGTTRTITQNDLDSDVRFYAGDVDVTANISNFMIRINSESDATYAPYSNICPISGFTGMNIMGTGVNVWDEETELGTIDGNGNNAMLNNFFRTKNFVSIKPDTSYYVKVGADINIRIFYYRNDKSFIKFVDAQNAIITTPSNAAYLRFRPYQAYGATYNHDISINYPATDTEYHAYTGQTHPITFPQEAGTVYGGYVDTVKGKLVVDRLFVTVDGSGVHPEINASGVGISKGTASNPNGIPYYITIGGSGNKAIYYPNINKITTGTCAICDTYVSTPNNGGNAGSLKTNQFRLGNNTVDSNSKLFYFIRPETSVENLLVSLSNNPFHFVYYLATPITYDLTPQQIALLLGVNNVWNDTNGDTDVEYKADTKLYIEQLTKPTEDDMTANTAITSGKFFMVGNRLFISTTTIASGDTINPGTNCTELSLADALNSL